MRGDSSLNHQNSCFHAELNDETNEVNLELLTCFDDSLYDLHQYHYTRQLILVYCMFCTCLLLII